VTRASSRIAEIRCSVPAEKVSGYFEKTQGHWIIDSEIANPMSIYPEYKARRSSWGAKANGTVLVELITESGLVGLGMSQGGIPASRIIIDHLSLFLLGSDPRDTERLWEQMFRATLPMDAGSAALRDQCGRSRALGSLWKTPR